MVSFSDLAFFLFFMPHSLAVIDHFGRDMTFRYYYFLYRQELSALANFFSASAIW